MRPVAVDSGAAALVELRRRRDAGDPFRVVLLDLMMPHMDGFEVMSDLHREISAGTYLPILVLTADASRDSRNRALSMGANEFLTKPFDQEEVTLRIRNLLLTRLLYLGLVEQQQLLDQSLEERTRDLRQSLDLLERTAEDRRKLLEKFISAATVPG